MPSSVECGTGIRGAQKVVTVNDLPDAGCAVRRSRRVQSFVAGSLPCGSWSRWYDTMNSRSIHSNGRRDVEHATAKRKPGQRKAIERPDHAVPILGRRHLDLCKSERIPGSFLLHCHHRNTGNVRVLFAYASQFLAADRRRQSMNIHHAFRLHSVRRIPARSCRSKLPEVTGRLPAGIPPRQQ
jgi:hypothetical protein